MKQILSLFLLVGGASCSALQADQMPDTMHVTTPLSAQTEVTEWNFVQGVDTAGDEGRGDWFKKKRIVQQARKLYQELHDLVKKIVEGHDGLLKGYAPELAELSKKLADLALQPADIESKLQALNGSIETLAAKEKLTDAERKELIGQQDSKNMLQQFFEELTFATELEQGLKQAVTIADAQVEQCKIYEKKAWNLYEAIDAALNDTIAEQMLEEIQTIVENVGLIGHYLATDLNGYFQKSIPLLKEQEQKIAEQYTLLQVRGVLEKKLSAHELAAEKAKAAQAAQAKEEHSWWQLILSPFIWLWNWIVSFF